MVGLEKYTDGLQMDKFPTIKEISVYSNIYCVGFDGDLLFGEADDDNTTEWFLVENESFKYLGESHTTEGDKLIRYKTRQT